MMTKLRWVCLGWLFVGACGDSGGAEPSTFLLPSVDIASEGVPGIDSFVQFVDQGAQCVTRYDFAAEDTDVECHTERVGGSASHWITTCPEHVMLASQELRLDERGRELFIHQHNEWMSWSFTFSYDEIGRPHQIVGQDGEWVQTYDEYDAAGRPLHATRESPDWEGLPGTGRTVLAFGYDEHGRIVFREGRFVSTGAAWWSETITYDDAARRRTREVIGDFTSVDPLGIRTVTRGYDLFDAEGRLVEEYWNRAQTPEELDDWMYTYRYDEQGRLLTHTFDEGSHSNETHYVAHHIYDCE